MPSSQDVSRKLRILVMTGTTGFDSLVRVIDLDRDLESLADIVIQVGHGKYLPVNKSFFIFDENIKDKLEGYHFFVTHAGAGSIFTLLEQGKRALVVPNTERADKHQVELVKYVQDNQLCAVCWDVREVPQVVREIEVRTRHLQAYQKHEFGAVNQLLDYIYGR